MPIQVSHLTLTQLNQLVARFEGVEVVIRRDHVAEEMEFEPEGPANDYDLKAFKMWKFYEPTRDWAITGPILERERINLTTYADEWEEERPYYGAMYGDFEHEQQGTTACEAVIRSFIAKHFGDTIDLENLPTFKRTYIIKVNGFTEAEFVDFEFEGEPFVEEEIEVEAETEAQAKRLAGDKFNLMHEHTEILDADFIRWK